MLIENGTTPRLPILMTDATDNETGVTGLTVTVTLSINGEAFAAADGTVTEIGSGFYYYTPTADETGTDGPLIIKATGTGANEYREVHQVYTSLQATVGSAVVDFKGPVLESGDIHLTQGDDYTVDAGQPLEWSSSDWPDLTGGSVSLYAWLNSDPATTFTKAGSIPTAGAGTQTVRVEPVAADTAGLTPFTTDGGGYTFHVKATLAGGEVVTLVKGRMTVEPDLSA